MALTEFPAALGMSVGDMIYRIKREHLRGTQRPPMNRLNGVVTTGQATATMEFTSSNPLREGDMVEIDDELLYVWSVAGAVATVQRAMDGSTAAQHATQSLIEINPRYTRLDIFEAIRAEIASLPNNIFSVAAGSFSLGSRVSAIDLTGIPASATGVRLLAIYRDQLGNLSPYYTRESWPAVPRARIEPRQDSTSFPSGYSIVLPEEFDEGVNLRVVVGYRPLLPTLTTALDLGTGCHLTADLVDAVRFGAAGRLVMGKETARNDPTAQGRSRRAEEVPSGATFRTGAQLWQARDNLLAQAAKRLASEWGWREQTW
jgi:hypothetical protein